MWTLIASVTCVLTVNSVHAAIIQDDARMSADDFTAEQAGCTARSAEMKLAKACYTGGMDVSSPIKFVGTVGDDAKPRYCYNALVIASKTGIKSQIQVLRDNEHGQARVENFTLPQGVVAAKDGKAVTLVGTDGHCVSKTKIDGPSCVATPLSLGYSGTPGADVTIDSVSPGARGTKVSVSNGDQDLNKIAATLAADVDRRLALAAQQIVAESGKVTRGPAVDALKQKAKAIVDCGAAASDYRGKNKMVKSDPDADAQRRQYVDAAKRVEAGQPASVGSPAGAGATGSSR